MKKNLEWLKEKIKEEHEYNRAEHNKGGFEGYAHRGFAFKYVLKLINQLDEPEVLSQELPVIPNYVAKWISEHHERFDLYPALKRLENNALDWGDVHDWYRKNTRKFVNAYLTGKYEVEVEKEQKYYVILEENSYGAMGLGIGREGRLTFTATHDKWSLPKLTEQEIKDYDERYWPFAVKVEELEE